MQTDPVFLGVDVSKVELVVASHGPSRSLARVCNDVVSIEAWLSTVPRPACIAMESTGRYHGLLARLASAAGFLVYVLNAADLYFYAQQQGTRAKTDRLDAQRIADYLAEHHRRLHPWQSTDSVHYRVQGVLQRRARVVKHQEAIRQCLRDAPELAGPAGQLHDEFERFLREVDRHLEQLVASDERLLQGCRRLRTIPGIGAQTSTLLAALLSRIPFANADALVAFCGLDPRAVDSGTKRGRRRLTKRGPALLRRQLWLAAFAGTRTAALKPLYEQLRQRGFASTEAVVILARKLLRVAFAVWRSDGGFKQELLAPRT
jgi:transposase